ncbi:MAG TPA: hypothetical protein VJ777_10950 [Mycobacterium sp.]|nr:hypothetical protein [Mycobacterium sp.]
MSSLDVEPQPLGQETVGTTPVLIYTVPAVSPDSGLTVKSATIRKINAANLKSTPGRVRVWIVPPSGTPDDSTVLMPDLIVPENGVGWDDGITVINAGGEIWGSGDSVDAFTITVSGALTVVVP